MSEHINTLDLKKYVDLLVALNHEECDDDCEQPCAITENLKYAAYDMLERLSAEGWDAVGLLRRWRHLFTELGCPDVTDGKLFSESGDFCRDIHEFREIEADSRIKMSGPSRDLPKYEGPLSPVSEGQAK